MRQPHPWKGRTMRSIRPRRFTLPLTLYLSAQPPVVAAQTRDEAAVHAVIAGYVQSLNIHDLEAVVALFVPAGEVLPPGAPPVVGIEAVRARYQGLFASEVLNVRFTPVETVVTG